MELIVFNLTNDIFFSIPHSQIFIKNFILIDITVWGLFLLSAIII